MCVSGPDCVDHDIDSAFLDGVWNKNQRVLLLLYLLFLCGIENIQDVTIRKYGNSSSCLNELSMSV